MVAERDAFYSQDFTSSSEEVKEEKMMGIKELN